MKMIVTYGETTATPAGEKMSTPGVDSGAGDDAGGIPVPKGRDWHAA